MTTHINIPKSLNNKNKHDGQTDRHTHNVMFARFEIIKLVQNAKVNIKRMSK